VVLLAATVVGATLAGLLRTPSGAHALRHHLRGGRLLLAGALLTVASAALAGALSTVVLTAALAVLLSAAILNRGLTGVAVMAVGLGLNLGALVVNGGMPVRGSALVHAGVVTSDELGSVVLDAPRHLEHDGDPVPALGDVLPLPVTGEVVSFGDLLIVVGAADAVWELTRRRRRPGYAPTTMASALQVWGTAPSARPVSASQYSAYPDATAPSTIDLDSDAAASRAPELVAARHSR